jgi:hypothetical protein
MGGRKIHVGSRTPVFRVRYKQPDGIRSRLFLSISQCPPSVPGRILRINKVSPEETWKIGEFNMMPKVLMREFRNKAKKPAFDEKMAQVEKELHMMTETEQI